MNINLYANYRQVTSTKSVMIPFSGKKEIISILHEVLKIYPQLRDHWLDHDGEFYPHILIVFKNSNVITLPEKLNTFVENSDKLDIFPPLSGG